MDEIEKAFREWYEETCGIDRDDYDMDEVSGTFDVWKAATRRERDRCARMIYADPVLALAVKDRIAAAIRESRDE